MTSVRQKNNARRKECTVREHATCRPATLDATEVSFVMSASKISSTDGSLKVSSAGTTKKNMERQMNEKDWRPQPGKWCGGVVVWGEKPKTELEVPWERGELLLLLSVL